MITTRRQADGAIVVEIRGILDAATVDPVRSQLLGVLQRDRPRLLVVDMMFVTFMDSSGMRALVAAHGAARDIGARVQLRNLSEFVHRQLRITGLTDLFGVPAVNTGGYRL
ncbi:STAS domain-containing protein [Actinoplanes sp. DH11]|uniref:STAS domain-containing protein n=1 Tax=Actinoplanes sp. DH11 TaxID=2857011 RepID=UPI001E53E499|nr:STAS domain-containing protein [Actinoplanes sp. DH11]